jgi:hypothetical protein
MGKNDRIGKGRMRVVVFDLEGSDETLQESLRSVTSLISRGLGPQTRVIAQAALPPSQEHDDDGHENAGSNDEQFEEADGAAASSSSRAKRNRRFPVPQVLSDVDLESGEVSFKAFYERKNPTQHNKRYLVIAAWFREYRNLTAITPDHIFTCYRVLGLSTPSDVGAPLRSMKNQNNWFDNGSAPNSYLINLVGLNVVNEMGKGD